MNCNKQTRRILWIILNATLAAVLVGIILVKFFPDSPSQVDNQDEYLEPCNPDFNELVTAGLKSADSSATEFTFSCGTRINTEYGFFAAETCGPNEPASPEGGIIISKNHNSPIVGTSSP